MNTKIKVIYNPFRTLFRTKHFKQSALLAPSFYERIAQTYNLLTGDTSNQKKHFLGLLDYVIPIQFLFNYLADYYYHKKVKDNFGEIPENNLVRYAALQAVAQLGRFIKAAIGAVLTALLLPLVLTVHLIIRPLQSYLQRIVKNLFKEHLLKNAAALDQTQEKHTHSSTYLQYALIVNGDSNTIELRKPNPMLHLSSEVIHSSEITKHTKNIWVVAREETNQVAWKSLPQKSLKALFWLNVGHIVNNTERTHLDDDLVEIDQFITSGSVKEQSSEAPQNRGIQEERSSEATAPAGPSTVAPSC